jgi:Uma2 family endonuclease
MATQATKASKPTIEPQEPNLYRLSVKHFLQMVEAGIVKEDEPVELLGGLIFEKSVKRARHNFGVGSLAEHLRDIVSPGWIVREEKSLDLDPFSRPEPDIVVARGSHDIYCHHDPTAKDLALIIEVADSSYMKDRGWKWNLYAAAKVPVYIILNIHDRHMELYRKPFGRGETARYRETEVFDESSFLPVVIEGKELGRIAIREVMV